MKEIIKLSLVFVVSFIMLLSPPAEALSSVLKSGSSGSDVTFIQQLLIEKEYLHHEATGYYGPLTTKAVMTFQQEHNLKADGIVGPKTYSALILTRDTVPPANDKSMEIPSEGEYLDWYQEVQHIFPVGTIATVTDVDTGLSFRIMRTFGHNHADCETLSVEDTAVLKHIWGGWSWERRAVIVTVGDRHIAASSVAMPHAGMDNHPALKPISSRSGGYGKGLNYDRIKDNGMDGHICVHFRNSTLHSTDKPDPEHQKMVKKAAGL